jgi:hypothetical protein
MDHLHATLAELHAENKSAQAAARPGHLTVFREFLTQLDRLQAKPPPRQARPGRPPSRKPRRARG